MISSVQERRFHSAPPPHFCSFPHFCHQRMSECTISKILTKNISMYHLTAATNRYINVQSHSCHQRIYQCTIPQLPRLYTNVPSYSFHQRIYQCTVPQLPPQNIPVYHPTAATKENLNVLSHSCHQRIYHCTVPQLPPKNISMYHPTAAPKHYLNIPSHSCHQRISHIWQYFIESRGFELSMNALPISACATLRSPPKMTGFFVFKSFRYSRKSLSHSWRYSNLLKDKNTTRNLKGFKNCHLI